MPFYTWDLGICIFWYLQGLLEQVSWDYQGMTVYGDPLCVFDLDIFLSCIFHIKVLSVLWQLCCFAISLTWITTYLKMCLLWDQWWTLYYFPSRKRNIIPIIFSPFKTVYYIFSNIKIINIFNRLLNTFWKYKEMMSFPLKHLLFIRIMKVKVLVAPSCPTLCNPTDCSLPVSSCPWNSPGKNTGVGSHSLLNGFFPTQGSNPGLLQCRQILYHLHFFPTEASIIYLHRTKYNNG